MTTDFICTGSRLSFTRRFPRPITWSKKLTALFIIGLVFIYGLLIQMEGDYDKNKYIKGKVSAALKRIRQDNSSDNMLQCDRVNAEIWRSRELVSDYHFVDPKKQVVDDLLNIVNEPKSGCERPGNSSHSPYLVVLAVITSRGNWYRRQMIRKTWGSLQWYKEWRIKLVFMLGQSSYCLKSNYPSSVKTTEWMQVKHEEMGIEEEQRKYNDLVIGAFIDTYRNLTYKSLMIHGYLNSRCPKADLLIRTDDDFFVNVPAILTAVSADLQNDTSLVDMYCRIFKNRFPHRCKHCQFGKYSSTVEEWPSNTYPTFCYGPSLIISKVWSKYLYSVHLNGGFYWLEDVFITGKLREVAEARYGVVARLKDISKLLNNKGGEQWFSNFFQKFPMKTLRKKRKEGLLWFKQIPDNKYYTERMKKLWEIAQ